MYELTLTREAQRFYQQANAPLVKRLNRCFDQLSQGPYDHPNIKQLQGQLAGYFRYRVGDWPVIYQVDEEAERITILLIVHRSKAYE